MATEITMNDLLQATIDEGASDLHVRAFMPPKLRIHGELVAIADEAFDEDDTFKLCHEIMTAEQSAEVEKNGGADFALAHEDGTRFRVSVFKERKRWGCVLRMIPSTLLTLEQIGLPDTVKELLFKPRGLILVTGPTGSGKSTTLASMLNVINRERGVHIITIEDPIEFYHTSQKSLVTQREVGDDVPSFAEAIRRALRQDPDVILVGEMRDLETIGAAITAAETGHLVARERSQLWLHSAIGYVLQTPHLFSGTLRENLLYGNPNATEEEIRSALALVSATDVADRLENGLDTDVGEGGDLLSTGEKQLVSFARAILADPRILVLDEATASVDTITEQKIQSAIDTIIRGRTSIVIAHRLSTVRNADVILVVHRGKIVEQGRHDELMARKGYYYRLYTRQYEDEATQNALG